MEYVMAPDSYMDKFIENFGLDHIPADAYAEAEAEDILDGRVTDEEDAAAEEETDDEDVMEEDSNDEETPTEDGDVGDENAEDEENGVNEE